MAKNFIEACRVRTQQAVGIMRETSPGVAEVLSNTSNEFCDSQDCLGKGACALAQGPRPETATQIKDLNRSGQQAFWRAVVINQFLPDDSQDPSLGSWGSIQLIRGEEQNNQ